MSINILTYGTFDTLHFGHIILLNRLKAMGDQLLVGVSTDEFNLKKNKVAMIPYHERIAMVRSIRAVDFVFAENSWEQKIEDIKKYNIHIFAIGDDWSGKFDYLKPYCKVIYVPRTKNISSTQIRNIAVL